MLFFLMQISDRVAVQATITPILSSLFIVAFFGLLGRHQREEPMQTLLAEHIMLVPAGRRPVFPEFHHWHSVSDQGTRDEAEAGGHGAPPPAAAGIAGQAEPADLAGGLSGADRRDFSRRVGRPLQAGIRQLDDGREDRLVHRRLDLLRRGAAHALEFQESGRVVPVLSIIGFSIPCWHCSSGVYASGSRHSE